MRKIAALVLVSLFWSTAAHADQGVDPTVALKERIADLEQQNATLRRQWGQATMEIDRLRAKNEELTQRLDALTNTQPAAPQAAARTIETPTAPTAAPPAPADTRVAELEAELARLRSQNQELQTQKAQLTELAGVTPEGERVASAEARITTETDEGQTVVRSLPAKLHMLSGSRADHYLTLGYSYPAGGKPAASLPLTGYLQTAFSGRLYDHANAVIITVDGGETVTLPIVDYDRNHRMTGVAGKRRLDNSDETLTFEVSPEAVQRLAAATTATGRIAAVTFELSREQLALFRALQKRIEMGL